MKKPEKFLFDQNVFDEPDQEEEENLEPPAPTFSEAELENVRKQTYDLAYNKGKQEGLAESRASREQKVAHILQKISVDAGLLFAAEEKREKLFEIESVQLCLSVLQKLFPVFLERFGQEECREFLQTVLQRQEGLSEIRVEVMPDAVDDIENSLKNLTLENAAQRRFSVEGSATIGDGACRLSWKDGGAIRNSQALSDEILDILRTALAENPVNSHDEGEESIVPPPSSKLERNLQREMRKEARGNDPNASITSATARNDEMEKDDE